MMIRDKYVMLVLLLETHTPGFRQSVCLLDKNLILILARLLAFLKQDGYSNRLEHLILL